ncbi:MAG: M50 family metallopeptidase, partial [Deltaproteobacteria bacterium]|nr:M50 family metallopeptidase [Deltaproteobacteria bacterium]
MTDPKLIQERTAYHESGHAVLAYLMGRRVLEIQLFPHKTHIYN